MQELTTTLKRTGVLVHGKNGEADKTISHTDYLDGLSSIFGAVITDVNESEQESSKNPFLLPPNVYLFHPGKKFTEIGMFYRERVVPQVVFKYDDEEVHKDFRLPNIVISVKLKTSKDPRNKDIAFALSDVRFFATDGGPLSLPRRLLTAPSDRDHIWALPLPNMYPEAKMCYGQNSLISTYTRDLRPLHLLFRMIHESPFNSDLHIPSLSEESSPRNWLRKLSEESKESYPYRLLRHFNPEKHEQNQAEFQYIATSTTE